MWVLNSFDKDKINPLWRSDKRFRDFLFSPVSSLDIRDDGTRFKMRIIQPIGGVIEIYINLTILIQILIFAYLSFTFIYILNIVAESALIYPYMICVFNPIN